MKKNIIYCSDACSFCQRAYQLLESKGINFKKHYVKTPDDWNKLMEKTGKNTVPQIFINDIYIGGFDDLSAANASGKLEKILNQ